MSSGFDLMEMVNHALLFFGLLASGASLLACILYRRVSGAMTLLILAFAGDVIVTFLYLALGLTTQFILEYGFDNVTQLYSLIGFLGFGVSALTAVGIFMVLGDIARRQDRSRLRGPDDDFDRRPARYDDRDEPRWERDRGGPDIRR